MDEESMELTAFLGPTNEVYEYCYLPQGVKLGSSLFSCAIDKILGNLRFSVCCCFIDDIVVWGKSFEEHLANLDAVLTAMEDYGLKCNPAKCKFFVDKFKFVGHIVSAAGIEPDPDKVKAIWHMRVDSKATLMTFIGMISYYRKFITHLSKVAHPLSIVLKKELKFKKFRKWSQMELEAINDLKLQLVRRPILAHPDWSLPFELHTDACREGLSGILTQTQNGKEVVICYASRTPTEAEKKYQIFELEFLAVVWACQHYRMYLALPFAFPFKIVTDNDAVKWIMERHKFNSRLMHWVLQMSAYDYTIVHRAGKKHGDADALSRNNLPSTSPYGDSDVVKPLTERNAVIITASLRRLKAFFPPDDKEAWSLKEVAKLQEEDEECKRYKTKIGSKNFEDNFVLKDGVLWRKLRELKTKPLIKRQWQRELRRDDLRLVIPQTLKHFILRQHHGAPLSAHQGMSKAYAQISTRFWWKGIWKDVRRHINACVACACRKTPRPQNMGVTSSVAAPFVLHTLSMDLMGPLVETSEGNLYILVVIDLFSRFPILIPIKSPSSKAVADALFHHVLCLFGAPVKILTDRGSEFINKGLEEMCKKWGIKRLLSSPRHKQGNSPAERHIRWVNSAMTMLGATFGKEWDRHLQACAFAYRCSVNRSTGYSPYQLMYGREPVLPMDLTLDMLPQTNYDTEESYGILTGEWLRQAFKHVRKQQSRTSQLSREAANRKNRHVIYEENDHVIYWQPQTSKKQTSKTSDEVLRGAPGKFTPRWTGPHKIIKKTSLNTYDVLHGKTQRVMKSLHIDTLWPFQPWNDEHPSTSPDVDIVRPWASGGTPAIGDLIAVPMEGDVTRFGIGILKEVKDEILHFQWLSNSRDSWASKGSPFREGWIDGRTDKEYWGAKKKPGDKPYTSEDSSTKIGFDSIMLHGFKLTAAKHLDTPTRLAIERSRNIWQEWHEQEDI